MRTPRDQREGITSRVQRRRNTKTAAGRPLVKFPGRNKHTRRKRAAS